MAVFTQKLFSKLLNVGKIFREPRFYADLALCAVVVLVIIVASGRSVPQLAQEAWAAVTSITGSGTQSALAQFSGTNTIGDATLTLSQIATDFSGGGSTGISIGSHFACFLASVYADEGHGHGLQCAVVGTAGGAWILYAYTKDEGQTQCQALCIN